MGKVVRKYGRVPTDEINPLLSQQRSWRGRERLCWLKSHQPKRTTYDGPTHRDSDRLPVSAASVDEGSSVFPSFLTLTLTPLILFSQCGRLHVSTSVAAVARPLRTCLLGLNGPTVLGYPKPGSLTTTSYNQLTRSKTNTTCHILLFLFCHTPVILMNQTHFMILTSCLLEAPPGRRQRPLSACRTRILLPGMTCPVSLLINHLYHRIKFTTHLVQNAPPPII